MVASRFRKINTPLFTVLILCWLIICLFLLGQTSVLAEELEEEQEAGQETGEAEHLPLVWEAEKTGVLNRPSAILWDGDRLIKTGVFSIAFSFDFDSDPELDPDPDPDSGPDSDSETDTWKKRYAGALSTLSDLAWNGSSYVVVGDDGHIASSPGGEEWTGQESGTGERLRGISWNGSRFVVVGDKKTILVSTTGSRWNDRSFSGYSEDELERKLERIENEIEIIDRAIRRLNQQVDARLLQQQENERKRLENEQSRLEDLLDGEPAALHDVAWNGRLFAAVGDEGNIYTSSRGHSWTERRSSTVRDLYGITWGEGRFVAVGSGGRIVTSINGMHWQRVDSGTEENLYDAAWSSYEFAVVGEKGTILVSSCGLEWEQVEITVIEAEDENDKGKDENDETNNETKGEDKEEGFSKSLYSITWADHRFVAVGERNLVVQSEVMERDDPAAGEDADPEKSNEKEGPAVD